MGAPHGPIKYLTADEYPCNVFQRSNSHAIINDERIFLMTQSETLVTILNGLNRLAYNVWWSWHADAQDLFGLIDNRLWKEVDRNPVVFLKRLSRESLTEVVSKKEVIDLYRHVLSGLEKYACGLFLRRVRTP